jgi:hypothetical protein
MQTPMNNPAPLRGSRPAGRPARLLGTEEVAVLEEIRDTGEPDEEPGDEEDGTDTESQDEGVEQ